MPTRDLLTYERRPTADGQRFGADRQAPEADIANFTRRTLFGAAGLGAGGLAMHDALGVQLVAGADAAVSAILLAKDFGAVGDGQADDTDALAALFAAMQAQGKPGLLGGHGWETRYLVRPGEWRWTFSNTPTVAAPGPAGPTLWTAGKVVIVAKPGGANAPLLSIHNDPRSGSRCVHGGYVGGMWFEDAERGTERHGLYLYGVEFMRFGPMFSHMLGGDLIHIGSRGDAVTADAWHVSSCVFEGATTWNTSGWTFNNDSVSQVFNFNQIVSLWNVGGAKGIFRGPGAGNTILACSCYQSRGWALDLVADTGTTQGLFIGAADLDAPEFGIRIDGLQFARLQYMRIAHRTATDHIPADVVWPRESLRLGGPTSGSATSDVEATILHRLDPNISEQSRVQLGTFSDFSNDPLVNRIRIEHHFNPAARMTKPSKNAFRHGIHHSSTGNVVVLDGQTIRDDRIKNALRAHATRGEVFNSGYLTPISRVTFDVANLDDGSNFDRDHSQFIVPYAALYRVRAQLRFAARGGAVRMAIVATRSGVDLPIDEAFHNAVSGAQTFSVECLDYFEQGDRIWISAWQSGFEQAVGLETGTGAVLNNRFEVFPI